MVDSLALNHHWKTDMSRLRIKSNKNLLLPLHNFMYTTPTMVFFCRNSKT